MELEVLTYVCGGVRWLKKAACTNREIFSLQENLSLETLSSGRGRAGTAVCLREVT